MFIGSFAHIPLTFFRNSYCAIVAKIRPDLFAASSAIRIIANHRITTKAFIFQRHCNSSFSIVVCLENHELVFRQTRSWLLRALAFQKEKCIFCTSPPWKTASQHVLFKPGRVLEPSVCLLKSSKAHRPILSDRGFLSKKPSGGGRPALLRHRHH